MNIGKKHFLIKKSEKDVEGLLECKRSSLERNNRQKFDLDGYLFRDYIVQKSWGYEYLIFKNKTTEAWVLNFTTNVGTSYHCHEKTCTILIALNGLVICDTLTTRYNLYQGDSAFIEPGAFHSISSGDSASTAIEFISPPNRFDLHRLKSFDGNKFNDAAKHSYSRNAGLIKINSKNNLFDFFDSSKNTIQIAFDKYIGFGSAEFLSDILASSNSLDSIIIGIGEFTINIIPSDKFLRHEWDTSLNEYFFMLKN